jgi:hypothetical protein
VSEQHVDRRFRSALEQARAGWAAADLGGRAAQAGCTVSETGVLVSFFGVPHLVTHPAGEVTAGARPAATPVSVALLHYLLRADGTPMAYEWRSYRDLPDGLFYAQAFTDRSERPMTEAFGRAGAPAKGSEGAHQPRAGIERFRAAASALGGEALDLADAAYAFTALPRLRVAALLWLGDEDFPGQASIVFDAAAPHYLPAEDLAGLGGLLAHRLLAAPG